MKTVLGTGLASLATIFTTTALAHSGLNDHSNVLATVHDLSHAASAWPAIASVIGGIGLVLALVVVFRRSRRSESRRLMQQSK